jgi:deoxyribonucleoside regulator
MAGDTDNEPPRRPTRAQRSDALIEAAWLHYHEALNQSEVADRMGVSRATVVNYLQEARASGLIRVTLAEEPFVRHRLSLALSQRFGLKGARVVPTDAEGVETLSRVARGAADWLLSLLVPGDRLGVAWGQTVFEVAEQMDPTALSDLEVLQLVGAVPSPFGFTAEACTTNLARKLSATCVNLFAPAILSSVENAALLRGEPITAGQLERLRTCNKAIFAAGSCLPESHIVGTGVATLDDLRSYVKAGARAVLCGRFVDSAGSHIQGQLDQRIIGVTPDQLRGLEMGLLVSCGPEKVEPMRAVLAGGYATHLVTDHATAEAMLAGP